MLKMAYCFTVKHHVRIDIESAPPNGYIAGMHPLGGRRKAAPLREGNTLWKQWS